MSRSLDDLTPPMKSMAEEVVKRCGEKGFTLLVYCTHRNCAEQARLFRQSRFLLEIEFRAEKYRTMGLEFLADILIGVGPQNGTIGKHVTNAGPGESWHQYGRAFDAVPLRDGKLMWRSDAPEWLTYGEIVEEVSLCWAGNWANFKEYPHAQDTDSPYPLTALTLEEIKEALK